jgi:hypothetical protein
VITFGTEATRRSLAIRMAAEPSPEFVRVLGETIRSDESDELRDRCRQVLVVMAESGSADATALLDELNAPV